MERYGITKWSTRLYNQNNQLIYQENGRPNLLHYEGEQYVLASAFHTVLEGFVVPPVLYIGVDSRNKLQPKDTLVDVAVTEMKLKSYARIPVSTGGGFLPSWEKPLKESELNDPVFVLNATATFVAKGEDMGLVKNYFLTTAAEGTGGLLLVSSSLRKPFDLDKGYKLTVGMSVSLREAKLEN